MVFLEKTTETIGFCNYLKICYVENNTSPRNVDCNHKMIEVFFKIEFLAFINFQRRSRHKEKDEK